MESSDRDLIQEQIEYYSRRAPEYDETATPPGDPLRHHGQRIEEALHRFAPSGSVLEIACGTGSWTRLLVRHSNDVTALDSSGEMLELNRVKVADPRVSYIRADIFEWEPDRRYDVVFFANWLSHVPLTRFEEFWSLVEQCLDVDGRVFFTDEAKDVWRDDESRREDIVEYPKAPLVRRNLRDGSSYRVVKVFWDPGELAASLDRRGWQIAMHSTGAFFWGEGRRRHS